MSFADDKLYNGYLRRNMAAIVTRVRVREIMVHLPCLTQHDREIIEAKREISGNYNGMTLLLDCLKRRENWPEQFIDALEACEQLTIAAEIRAEYNALRGINNPSPSSPPTTVIRAHVHPAPAASGPSVPGSAAVAPPPAEPPVQSPPPLEIPAQPQAPQSPAAQVPQVASPPEPIPEPSESTPAPSTPPPSPETPRPQATTPPAPQREITAPLEPEENSESDIQDVSDDEGVIPDQVSSGNDEISVDSVGTPEPSDTPSRPDYIQTTSTIEYRPPQSPSPTCMNSDETDGSSTPTLTPEKPPVQDTMPPVDKAPAAVLQPEETSEPPPTQVIESHPQTETTATASTLPAAAGIDTLHYEDSVCLSKPGQLISIHPQNHADPTNPAPGHPLEPYSGNSDRLEISEAAPDTVTSVPACSPVNSETVTAPPCVENGVALDHNEPEENHYESPGQSLDMQDVQENVVHVAEEPSILNLDGQSSTPQVNGEAPKEITSAPPATAADTGSSLNDPSSAPGPADTAPEVKTLQDSEEKTAPRTAPANTKYILTAAGVGACALLIAWRFKN